MPIEYTKTEIKVLNMLMKIAETIIYTQDGIIDIDDVSFSDNDLVDLKVKLGLVE